MRIAARLLGTLLTVGSAYVAEIAVESARPALAARPLRDASICPAASPIWYGGVLEPVTTVEARLNPTPGVGFAERHPRDRVSETQSVDTEHRRTGRASHRIQATN